MFNSDSCTVQEDLWYCTSTFQRATKMNLYCLIFRSFCLVWPSTLQLRYTFLFAPYKTNSTVQRPEIHEPYPEIGDFHLQLTLWTKNIGALWNFYSSPINVSAQGRHFRKHTIHPRILMIINSTMKSVTSVLSIVVPLATSLLLPLPQVVSSRVPLPLPVPSLVTVASLCDAASRGSLYRCRSS